jgi:hypothetical protein
MANRFLPEMLLTREMQFCVLCYSQGRGWVRIANVADMVELRKGRSEAQAQRVYQKRRRAAMVAHVRDQHPQVELRTGGYPDSTRRS